MKKMGSLKEIELADKIYSLEVRRRELIEKINRRKREGLSILSVRHRKLVEELKEVYRKQSDVRSTNMSA